MEGVEAEYGVVEWTIENFSCWNKDIHHEVITSLIFLGDFHFEICPRGGRNPVEKMSVRMLGAPPVAVFGYLSLIASDGYLFCSEAVEIDSQRQAFELSSAPTFEYIVEHSKMNEGLHKDQVFLRFQVRAAVSNSVLRMRTAICVHEFPYRIPEVKLYNISLHGLVDRCIHTIVYPSGDGVLSRINLYAAVGGHRDLYIVFALQQTGPQETVFIRSRMAALDKKGTVQGRTIDERVWCTDNGYWSLPYFLTRARIQEKRTFWHLRIVPENRSPLLCTYYEATDQGPNLPTVALSPPTSNEYVEKPLENDKADASNQPALNALSKDLMCLYRDQTSSDVTLKCDNTSFPVHKIILSARSPVFKTMLSTDMKEAASGTVDIEDLDPSTLGLFVTYLYTGVVELQYDSAIKLYYAADKYEVPSLKMDCSKFLCDNVSGSNVCDILSFAERHGDDQLTSAAHDFILDNLSAVLGSQEWGTLTEIKPKLAAKTMTQFAMEGHLQRKDFKRRKVTN